MKYTIQENSTILETLAVFYPDSSKTTLRSWLKDGRVFINAKKVVQASSPVEKGQILEVKLKKITLDRNLHILYEDRDLVVVDKPPGLLSVGTESESEETVHNFLKEYFPKNRVYPVHRLDQETSGVMVFALNEKTRNYFKELFEKHEIDRAYAAVVEGVFKKPNGTWRSYLYEDSNYVVHPTDNPNKGKLAITHFSCKKVGKNYSFLDLHLETGRKNQIRVHCSMADHPVAGDVKYGAQTNPIKRLALHAYLLAFMHPVKKKKMRFEVPIPKSMTQLF